MATCYSCGGYKPDGASCPACRKIESDKRLAEEQMEANREIAATQMKAQIAMTAMIAKDNQKKHDALMEQEEIRLKELKKQTQILLEQGLTVDEVYQEGFNFEDLNNDESISFERHIRLQLNDRGDFIAKYENPFIQSKFRKAYQEGIEDKIKKNYSKGAGIEFMSEAAFNHGYIRNGSCVIVYPGITNRPRWFFYPPRKPEISESINEQDGSVECNWIEPYDSEVLNQSFEAGINKYLKEQNTKAKKDSRLADIRAEQSSQRAIQAAKDEAAEALAKEAAEKASQEKFFNSIKGAIYGGLLGGFAGFPIFFFIWFFSIFFGGTSWTFVGFAESLAAIGVVVGLFAGSSM